MYRAKRHLAHLAGTQEDLDRVALRIVELVTLAQPNARANSNNNQGCDGSVQPGKHTEFHNSRTLRCIRSWECGCQSQVTAL